MAKGNTIQIQIDAETAKAIQSVQKFQKSATQSFNRTARAAKELKSILIGVGATIAGRAVAGAFVEAGKAAANFSLNVAEIETILPAGQKSTKELRQELFKLQTQFGGKAEKQAKAFYQTISAGITDAAEASEVLTVANKLAIGGIGDLEPTIDVLTSIVNTYGLENLSAAEASDLLFTTVKNGKTTLSELSQFIGKALPNSNRLGVSFSELTASIATLTSKGIDTAKASTQLTRLFGAIANGQDRAAKLGPEVAASFDLQALKAKGLIGFLDGVKVALRGDEAALQELLGSNEAASAFTVLTAQNFDKLTRSLKDNENAAGATEDAYERIFGTLAQQSKVLFGLGEQIAIEAGEEVTKGLADEFKNISEVIKKESKSIVKNVAYIGKAFLNLSRVFVSWGLQAIASINNVFVDISNLYDYILDKVSKIGVLDVVEDPDTQGWTRLNDEIKEAAKGIKDLSFLTDSRAQLAEAQAYRKQYRAYQTYMKQKEILDKEFQESHQKRIQNADDAKEFQGFVNRMQKLVEGIEIPVEIEDAKDKAKKVTKEVGGIVKKDPAEISFKDIDTKFVDSFNKETREKILAAAGDITEGMKSFQFSKDSSFLERLFNFDDISSMKSKVDDVIDRIKNTKGADGNPLFSPDEAKRFTAALKDGSKEAAEAYAKTLEQVFGVVGAGLSAISAGAKETVDPKKAFEESLESTNKEIAGLTEEYKRTTDADERTRIVEEIEKLRNESKIEANKARNEATKNNKKVAKDSAGQLVTKVGAGIADAFIPGLGQVVGPLLDIAQQDPEQLKIFIKSFTDSIPVIIEAIANNIDIIVIALAQGLIKALAVLSVKLVDWLWNGIKAGLDAFFGTFLQNIANGAKQFFAGLIEKLKQVFDPLLNIGQNILDAFINGAKAVYDSIADALSIDFGFGGGGGFGLGGDKGLLGGSIIPGFLNKGGIVHANSGAIVPGVGNRDKVPALLSPGELVLPQSATNSFASVVQEIAKQTVGGQTSGDGQMLKVELHIGDEVFAEKMLRINQDNYRVA